MHQLTFQNEFLVINERVRSDLDRQQRIILFQAKTSGFVSGLNALEAIRSDTKLFQRLHPLQTHLRHILEAIICNPNAFQIRAK